MEGGGDFLLTYGPLGFFCALFVGVIYKLSAKLEVLYEKRIIETIASRDKILEALQTVENLRKVVESQTR